MKGRPIQMLRFRLKQGVALTGRNTTGLPWTVAARPPARSAARPPSARRQCYRQRQMTDDDDRRQTPTDASGQINTGPLVINKLITSRLIHTRLYSFFGLVADLWLGMSQHDDRGSSYFMFELCRL